MDIVKEVMLQEFPCFEVSFRYMNWTTDDFISEDLEQNVDFLSVEPPYITLGELHPQNSKYGHWTESNLSGVVQ